MAINANVKLQANIVIIGGGGAGLTAAVAALEQGATDIIVLEKSNKLGGNAINPGGIFATDTDLERRLGQDAFKDDVFHKHMNYAHWKINGQLVRRLIDKSGDTIRWLEEKGVKFVDLVPHYHNQVPNTYHVVRGPLRTGAQIVKVLGQEVRESSNTRIMLNTQARKLLVDRKGNISGIIAQDIKGREITIRSSCVIICTGGFSGNEELIKQYDPSYNQDEAPPCGIPQQGDGIRLAGEIGAALDGMVVYEWGGFFTGSACLSMFARRYYTVWLNRKGERFFDESMPVSTEVANAVYKQPGRVIYCLFDEKIKERMQTEILTSYEELFLVANKEVPSSIPEKLERDLKNCAKEGTIKKSNSWNDIAQWINVNPQILNRTVDEYNNFCDQGHDEIFDKENAYLLPLRNPPFYALRCGLKLTNVHGGIKINHHMQGLDKNDDPIPGLYAAGIETGATESGSYDMGVSGHSFGFCINSGRIAGEEAARFVAQK
jgi:fumarate reductase flavoprotein subunit